MLIFLRSRRGSTPSTGRCSFKKGFTLIELLVSLSIIVILSGVVIAKFSTFDSTTLLKNAAFDVATTIREAQAYSLAAVGNQSNFRVPYGVTFVPDSQQYILFQETTDGGVPEYESSDIDLRISYLSRSIKVADICVVDSSGDECGLTRLDISFLRPEFRALIYAHGYAGSPADIIKAQIKLQSTRDATREWVVEIGKFGNISVVKS